MGYLIAYLLGIISATPPAQKIVDGVNPQTKTRQENKRIRGFMPLTHEVPPIEQNSDNTCRCSHHKTPWWKILLDVLTFLVAGAAAAAAIYYAYITNGMWIQMKAQTHNSQSQLVIEQRTWLQVTDNPAVAFTKGQPIGIPIRTTNVGKTPAQHIWWSVYTSVVPIGREPDLPTHHILPNDEIYKVKRTGTRSVDIPHQESERSLLYYGEHDDIVATRLERISRDGKSIVQPKTLTPEEWEGFAHGKNYIIVFGEVWYLDVFGITHWTKFCVSKTTSTANTSRKCVNFAGVDNNTE
jgi:hypothetical protein